MDHLMWITLTEDMIPQERGELFHKLPEELQNKLMQSTSEFLEMELSHDNTNRRV